MLLYRLNIHVVEVEMSACVSFSVAYLLIVYRTKRRGGRRYISLVVDHWLALRTHLLSQALTTALAPPWRGLQFRTFRSSREHEKRLREPSTLPPARQDTRGAHTISMVASRRLRHLLSKVPGARVDDHAVVGYLHGSNLFAVAREAFFH